jgi:EAL domain-containing protein (putative c-di-GMP-specific phosphodiesterase class I)
MEQPDFTLETLKSERDRFVAFAFASADLLIELNDKGDIAYADGATMGLLGLKSEDMVGKSFISFVNDADVKTAHEILSDAEHISRLENVKLRIDSKLHGKLPFAVSGFQLPYLKNHYYLTLSVAREDISPDDLNKRDLNTGLLKKENFAESANKKIREATESGQPLKMTLLNFPELKALLDGMPADESNHLVAAISDYLRSKSVDGDSAGLLKEGAYGFLHDEKLDEKKVLLELMQITKKADPSGQGIAMKAKTIKTEIGKLSEQDSANALLYTINKFANDKGNDFSIDSLQAGYQVMLDDTVNKITTFKNTVSGNQFQVAFQPIVNLKDGIIHHFETLVRFDKNDSFSNPFQFITFGEQAGIIGDFDMAMCQRTIEILNSAATKGNRPLVSVNLSGKSLSSGLFMDTISEILRRNDGVRKQVIFEITESAKISNLTQANNFVQELRSKGNLVCLDDFGVGESSFDYLRHLQIDFVKIDGSYVKESVSTPRGKHLLKAMAGLCRDLDIVTIGEMVEDDDIAHILWESGVKFGQGYLFGKPSVDEETLIHCSRPTPYYNGVMRAKKVGNRKGPWWKRVD